MSFAIENNSNKTHFNSNQDEANSQPSTTTSSPFNSFIVEYDIGAVNLYHQGSKEPNIRSKELTLSGELGQPRSVFSKHNMNPTMQPPSAQLMMGEYDPNRIPGSAFGNKNGTVDWSVTSNESLFSIHMGNASFNRDHPIYYQKSQELPRLDDMNMMNHSSGLPLPQNSENAMLLQAPTVVIPGTLEDHKREALTGIEERVSAELSSTSRNSNGSNSVMPPFSFPILDNPDSKNSLGMLSPAEINSHTFYFETPKIAPENHIIMNSPFSAAEPTVTSTSWFSFTCCRG